MNRKIIGVTVGTPLNPDKILENGVGGAIINSATGKTILTTDSANAPLVNLKAKGDTWQKQYEGKNMFDINANDNIIPANLASGVRNGENITVRAGSVNGGIYAILPQAIPLKGGLPYKASCKTVSTTGERTVELALFKANNIGAYLQTTTNKHYTPSEDMEINLGVYIQGTGNVGDTVTITDIQVEQNTVATPFEPYVGNAPSPNMEYEQPIESLENVEVKVLSGNLFDVDKFKNPSNWTGKTGNYYSQEINVPAGTYTLSFAENNINKNNQTAVDNAIALYVGTRKGTYLNNTLIGNYSSIETKTRYTFTVNNGETWYMNLYMNGKAPTEEGLSIVFDELIPNTMLNIGTEVFPYEPYKEQQTITINTPVPLTKWDKLIKRDGVWGWSIHHWNTIIDGNNTLAKYSAKNYEGFYVVNHSLPEISKRREGYCNQLRVATDTTITKDGLWLGTGTNKTIYMVNNSFYDATLEDYGVANLKAHLTENPLEIWTYTDAEQDFIPLADTEQEKIKSVLMNYPTTTILSNAELEVEYVADTKNYIDNKFKELEANVTSAIAQLL